MFQTVRAPGYHEIAPDGSTVFPLVRTGGSSVGLIQLEPGWVTAPVRHRTIEEVWYVLEGSGELWRQAGDEEEIVELAPGVCVTIPTGSSFQFRAAEGSMLRMLMLTVPPWPGDDEATPCDGPWEPQSQDRRG